MKRLILAGLVTAGALGAVLIPAPKAAADHDAGCAAVLCMVCPEGYVLSPTHGNCCRCVRA